MFEYHKKESPIISLLGMGGGIGSYIFTAADTGYEIARSLRLDSSSSAYLSRDPGSTGNRKTWTWSAWIKRTKSSSGATYQSIFTAGIDGNNNSGILFDNSDRIEIWNVVGNSNVTQKITNQVFRDFSSWYHLVVSVTSTTLSLYVNGVEVTSWATNNQPGDEDWSFNTTNTHYLAKYWDGGSGFPGDFYLADVWFIDGSALEPTEFGTFDDYGIWQPKSYTGSKSGNSFHLPFSDNTSTTTLGYDDSGNNNNWDVSGISVTPGAGNDSLLDSPSNADTTNDTGLGGEVAGNYCTMNPLDHKNCTFSNGNLNVTIGTNSNGRGTLFASSGKWYFEYEITTVGNPYVGIAGLGDLNTVWPDNVISVPNSGLISFVTNGGTRQEPGYTVRHNTSAIYSIAVDLDNKKIWWGKSGTWYAFDLSNYDQTSSKSDVEAGNDGFDFSSNTNTFWTVSLATSSNSSSYVLNTGQRAWAYPSMVPSGYKALCTANLPTPTIEDGSQYVGVTTYTGNGTSVTVADLSFSPDFVWVKGRSARNHGLFNTVTGVNRGLHSNLTDAEFNDPSTLTAFNSDGFALSTNITFNANTENFVAWTWEAGGEPTTDNVAGVGNVPTAGSVKIDGANMTTSLAGSIAATRLSANTTAGFSVVTYTGTGSAATVGHGLGAAPEMVIVKDKSGTGGYGWRVYHKSLTSGYVLYLNNTNAQTSESSAFTSAPTSTVVNLGTSGGTNSTEDFVMYAFAPVEGYSAFGSYTGNGSADGPFVYTGHRSRWILLKKSSSAGGWYIYDTARSTYNAAGVVLQPHDSAAEFNSSAYPFDILSNGFKSRTSDSLSNQSGQTYIYAAFAEHPFRSSRAR